MSPVRSRAKEMEKAEAQRQPLPYNPPKPRLFGPRCVHNHLRDCLNCNAKFRAAMSKTCDLCHRWALLTPPEGPNPIERASPLGRPESPNPYTFLRYPGHAEIRKLGRANLRPTPDNTPGDFMAQTAMMERDADTDDDDDVWVASTVACGSPQLS